MTTKLGTTKKINKMPKKPPRTAPFTARELIVELSRCDPYMPVYFEFAHDDGGKPPLMRGVDTIDPKVPYCNGGVAVILKSSTSAAVKK